MTRPEDLAPIRTQHDLCRFWQDLVGGRWSGRSLWLQFLDAEDAVTPFLTEVEGLPEQPEPAALHQLLDVCRRVVEESGGGRVAMLLTRPGPARTTASDRAWAAAILAAARARDVACAPVHVGTDDGVRPVPADDLDLTG